MPKSAVIGRHCHYLGSVVGVALVVVGLLQSSAQNVSGSSRVVIGYIIASALVAANK